MTTPKYPEPTGWVDVTNLEDTVQASHINQLYAEIDAIGPDLVSHKSDYMPHKAEDDEGNIYKWGITKQDGEWGILVEEVEE